MVIHIVAVKEKRSVSGFCHILIPLLAIFGVYLMISNMMSCISEIFVIFAYVVFLLKLVGSQNQTQ